MSRIEDATFETSVRQTSADRAGLALDAGNGSLPKKSLAEKAKSDHHVASLPKRNDSLEDDAGVAQVVRATVS